MKGSRCGWEKSQRNGSLPGHRVPQTEDTHVGAAFREQGSTAPDGGPATTTPPLLQAHSRLPGRALLNATYKLRGSPVHREQTCHRQSRWHPTPGTGLARRDSRPNSLLLLSPQSPSQVLTSATSARDTQQVSVKTHRGQLPKQSTTLPAVQSLRTQRGKSN